MDDKVFSLPQVP